MQAGRDTGESRKRYWGKQEENMRTAAMRD